jgi:hypothetical protein
MARPNYQQKLLGIILAYPTSKETDADVEYVVKQVLHQNRSIWYGVNYGYLLRELRKAAIARIKSEKEAVAKAKENEQRPPLVLTG